MMLESDTTQAAPSSAPYRAHRDKGAAAVRDGLWDEALPHLTQAWEWASEQGDEELRDRAFCNLSIVKIELRQADGCLAELGEILLRSRDPEGRWLAGYNISRAYELDKKFERGLFYGRIARDQARAMDREDLLAVSHNRLGNLHLGLSQTTEATRDYERALELLGRSDPSVHHARILDNLGYCRVLQGRLGEGFHLLFQSWRMLRSGRSKEALVSLHLDLSFAHLEIERPHHAARHATKALELARDLGDRDSVKNALFLLGESASLEGDEIGARRYYSELQTYYPELPVVTDILLAVDTRQMINLKA